MKKIVALLLLAVMMLTGCDGKAKNPEILKDGDTIGTGAAAFTFVIEDDQGERITVTVNTDEKTVGDALLKLHVIAGEQGAYGLYVDTVNGVTADYEKDQKYWAFYVDGAYAQEGISMTEINPDSVYMLKMEAAMD